MSGFAVLFINRSSKNMKTFMRLNLVGREQCLGLTEFDTMYPDGRLNTFLRYVLHPSAGENCYSH
jgi:hypothetical protein